MADRNQDSPDTALTTHVEGGGMTLYVQRRPSAPAEQLRPRVLLQALASQHVILTDELRQRITEIIKGWSSGEITDDKVLLARGRPARHGQDAKLIWAPQCDPQQLKAQLQQNDQFSHYRAQLINVQAGQEIARVEPATEGQPGENIFGQTLEARDGAPYEPVLGEGCHLEPGGRILADVSGTLRVKGDEIRVEEDLHIHGNIDFETGNVTTHGDLEVNGTVADKFEVFCGGDIEIREGVESARVLSRGNIVCHGHVSNRQKGVVLAGGDIETRLMDNSLAGARGDIVIRKEGMNSALFAGGRIVCVSGAISGGIVLARGGVEAKILGSPGAAHTLVIAGVDWLLAGEMAKIQAEIAELDKIIEQREGPVQTLKANLKRLTASQREQVTELEFQLDELLNERDDKQALIEGRQAESEQNCRPVVSVISEIHPGVELRLGAMKTVIENPIRGPVTLTVAEVLDEPVVVAKNESTGARQTLRSAHLSNPLLKVELPETPPERSAQATSV